MGFSKSSWETRVRDKILPILVSEAIKAEIAKIIDVEDLWSHDLEMLQESLKSMAVGDLVLITEFDRKRTLKAILDAYEVLDTDIVTSIRQMEVLLHRRIDLQPSLISSVRVSIKKMLYCSID